MKEVRKGLIDYFQFYNERKWPQNFDRKTPVMVYLSTQPQRLRHEHKPGAASHL